MEPNKPITPNNPPAGSSVPAMPQTLNPSAQTPTVMPMGEPTPPSQPPQAAGLPLQMTSPPEVSKSSNGTNTRLMIIIVLILLVILGGGGYYFYTNQMKSSITAPTESTDTDSGAGLDLNSLENEADAIEVEDPEGDIMEIDKEISLLEATPSSR